MGDQPPWSMRSVLTSVTDLERSAAFYADVVGLEPLFREDQVVILGNRSPRSFVLILREATRMAERIGQQALGMRAVSFDVGSTAELDRVEERLESHGLLRYRRRVSETDDFEIIHGHDPDGLPLIFSTASGGPYSDEHYRRVALLMYSLDI